MWNSVCSEVENRLLTWWLQVWNSTLWNYYVYKNSEKYCRELSSGYEYKTET